jgi:hypothetical protein
MVRFVQRQGRGLLVLLAVGAIALAACSGSTNTSAPSGTASPSATEATSGPADTQPIASSGLGGAASAFSALDSYKYSMTLVGGAAVTQIEMLPGVSITDPNAPVTIKGTVVSQPDKGLEVRIADFHMIAVGGFDYFDTGAGGYTQASDTGITDSFSPVQQFTTAIDPTTISGYDMVGSETKNGVLSDHYQASKSALAYLASIAGVQATWTSDVWLSAAGGYPVSMAVVAKASDNTIAYEILFDITDVNAASNKVTAPTNITGA